MALNRSYEDALYAQQVRQYGASSAKSLRNFGPPSTTNAFLTYNHYIILIFKLRSYLLEEEIIKQKN